MFKKPKLLCCGGLQLLSSPTAALPLARFSNGPPGSKPWPSHSKKAYATTTDPPEHEYSWPTTSSFTPYEVLNHHRTGPYSKQRYYDLVKIYHPDRPCNEHPLCKNITPEVRLHRYRIIVAAHEILSDPNRRAAYDQFGTGWSHSPKRYNTVADATAEWGPYGPTIYANATWEDWERWHNRDGGKQQTVVDHRTFLRLIFLLTLFGGAVQASWISQLNAGYEQRLREVSEDSMRFLNGRRQQTVEQMPSNDARVQSFLIRRDPTGSGLKDYEQSVYRKELHARDTASDSDQTQGQNASQTEATIHIVDERSEDVHESSPPGSV